MTHGVETKENRHARGLDGSGLDQNGKRKRFCPITRIPQKFSMIFLVALGQRLPDGIEIVDIGFWKV
jgi:hypothetical protein